MNKLLDGNEGNKVWSLAKSGDICFGFCVWVFFYEMQPASYTKKQGLFLREKGDYDGQLTAHLRAHSAEGYEILELHTSVPLYVVPSVMFN